ncbi:DUF4785 domain-containing protein [Arenimonas oryziterrae]|uniref:DUF4785 domain-containing protein n=1 Tax=Arenimonas oryziterrae DSM 21050 = YC6267 TaxID=1121015 RepID=A0A091BJX1_9GAMM|nr:DUF4785 domain-containing protein [Arenimonas oryziterrae]KFN44630.1 hypothetical protein N789_01070 [Arenimonas oryziterrae DSM 21050 = YC6267]
MRTLIAFALATASFSAFAGNANLDAPRRGDLVATRTVALPAPSGQIERQPVSFSWKLDPNAAVTEQTPFASESREYWTQVDSAELTRGFAIDTTAPGAVIRISPIGKAVPVPADNLMLLRDGRAISSTQSFARRTTAAQLQEAGMDIDNGAAVVQIAPGLGKGRFQVLMPEASGRYLVHVFEPESEYVLQARASQANVLAGGDVEVSAVLGKGDAGLPGSQLAGLLVSPSGKSYDLSFDRNGRALAHIPVDAGTEPGLWDVQVFAGASQGEGRIQRDTRTAIAVAQPTARLGNGVSFDALRLGFSVPVQVGSPGRYELRGTLFATGPDGLARPVSEAHSAAWFERGNRSLALAFDRSHLPPGYGAPFEVRQVQLNDQSRMGQLESRDLAVRVGTQGPFLPAPPAPVSPVVAPTRGRGNAGRFDR